MKVQHGVGGWVLEDYEWNRGSGRARLQYEHEVTHTKHEVIVKHLNSWSEPDHQYDAYEYERALRYCPSQEELEPYVQTRGRFYDSYEDEEEY